MTKNSLYLKWLESPKITQEEKKKLLKMDKNEIANSFSDVIDFGTSGIRGIMGLGTTKINRFVVYNLAISYSKYLKDNGLVKNGILIAHDNRKNGDYFSKLFASTLIANGISAFLFENNDLVPSPYLSFAIRHLKFDGGIMITASHNPKQYNGIKFYNNLGSILIDSESKKISNHFLQQDLLNFQKNKCNFKYISSDLESEYIKRVLSVRLNNYKFNLKIAFSAQHGTTGKLATKIFGQLGCDYKLVKKQMKIDSEFSHTKSPNPEDLSSFTKVRHLAWWTKSDIGLVTDPDGDRLGVIARYKRTYKYINANEIAAMYLDYKLKILKNSNKLNNNSYIIKSIVSSNLSKEVADHYGVKTIITNVGFKNISQIVNKLGEKDFILGFEESNGFLLDPSISRDKDSLQAMVGILEMANYIKSQGKTLHEYLLLLKKRSMPYYSTTISEVIDSSLLENAIQRLKKVKTLGKQKVKKIIDYSQSINSNPNYLNFKKTKLLEIILENGDKVMIRPSGTENKIKFYLDFCAGSSYHENINNANLVYDDIFNYFENIESKKLSIKSIIKYFIFFLILIGVFVLIFEFVYKDYGPYIIVKVWEHIHDSLGSSKIIWLILLFMSPYLTRFLEAIFTIRAMRAFGVKVKLRHSFIASIIAIVISSITPMAIGGSIGSYWYMRVTGYTRKQLAATYSLNIFIFQVKTGLVAILFLPLGLHYFHSVFFANTVVAKSILSFTLIGLGFDIFATFMIGTLIFSQKVHKFILHTSVKLLEFFSIVKRPDNVIAKYDSQIKDVRDSIYFIAKKKLLMMELFAYELLPILIVPHFFAAKIVGIPNEESNMYWKFIIGNKLISAANTLIPTPGASGTSEWFSMVLYREIFHNGNAAETQRIVEEFTGLQRVATYIVPILVSLWVLINAYVYSRHKIKNRINNKNRILNGTAAIKYTKFRNTLIIINSSLFIIFLSICLFFVFN